MVFENIEFLWLLLLLIPAFFFIKSNKHDLESLFKREVFDLIRVRNGAIPRKVRNILILSSISFVIIALARPQIDNGEIKVKSSFINVVVAIDMSRSMFVDDVYPNRFEFAKTKFIHSLDFFKKSRVGLIGFSSRTFLISPLTQDFFSLKYLAKNISLDYVSLKGTDFLNLLESADSLFKDEAKKIVLIFTDGGDKEDFSREIEYAREHNIVVYVYNIGTKKGGVIKLKNGGVLKNKNGDIVVVKRNDAIEKLALESGGAFMIYSLKRDDIKALVEAIESRHKNQRDDEVSTIKNRQELFYYPLAIALILLFIALFSLPEFKRGKKR